AMVGRASADQPPSRHPGHADHARRGDSDDVCRDASARAAAEAVALFVLDEAGDGVCRPGTSCRIRLPDCEAPRATPKIVCSAVGAVCMIVFMPTHVRKNITLPRSLDERFTKAARTRG